MESTAFHIFILGISLVCFYVFHATVGRSGNMIIGNEAIEIPLDPSSLSIIAEGYVPPTPAPLPASVSGHKGLLPARAQYRLPEIRLRRIRDQDIAARYEAARTVTKLKENDDEERFWKKYEKVMGYLRTPYEDLMEAFERSANE